MFARYLARMQNNHGTHSGKTPGHAGNPGQSIRVTSDCFRELSAYNPSGTAKYRKYGKYQRELNRA